VATVFLSLAFLLTAAVPAAAVPPRPASLAGFRDEGAFHLYQDGQRLGTIRFRWQADGSFENTSELSQAGKSVKQTLRITPAKDGSWDRIAIDATGGSALFVLEGDKIKLTAQGKDTLLDFSDGAAFQDMLSPALLSLPLLRYDHAKSGKQTLPVFLSVGGSQEMSVEKKDEVKRTVSGRDLKLTRYDANVLGSDLIIWADAAGKVYLFEEPVSQSAFVREGYESLREQPEKDPLLSQPTHEVKVESNVGVPMRDGVKLGTDLYRPQGEGKYPVILIRTLYQKELSERDGHYYARRGYVVAIQDVRGRFSSPGTGELFVHEPKDGYDAIEWLAAQPWSTGKVGMIGGSYLGWVQWWAAMEKPPHLVTIIPNVSPTSPFQNLPYEYGAFMLRGSLWWLGVVERTAPPEGSLRQLLHHLPVVELDTKVLGKEHPSWRKWIEHSTLDEYWEPVDFTSKLKDVRIPVFNQSGWYDGDGIGSKVNYQKMAEHGHPNQKLVVGPWGHTDRATRSYAGRDFGPEATPDLHRMYVRWFDCWLKGIDNGITREPLVSLFVMGSNRWATGDRYPLPETKFEKWYLSSNGNANTSKGDGKLTRELPPAGAPTDKYTYDPGDPTPDGNYEPEPGDRQGDKNNKSPSAEELQKLGDAYYQKLTASRKDILVYVSEKFAEPYTFAGPVSAVLYAATSARDTDWFMRLFEVDEQGNLFPLVEGKVRARYRKSMKSPELLEPGKVYEYQLDLWQTGITIPKGRRLRVEVASASFPSFTRNLNTGGHNETETRYVAAEQTIFHSKEHPSHVLLPVIPEPQAKNPDGK
jgi:putative CocE/NonD family hydrolase